MFGLSCKVRNNVDYIDDETVLYPAGNQIVLYNYEKATQRFLSVKEGIAISTIAVARTFGLVAVGVKTESAPIIVAYDVVHPKRKKIFKAADLSPGNVRNERRLGEREREKIYDDLSKPELIKSLLSSYRSL